MKARHLIILLSLIVTACATDDDAFTTSLRPMLFEVVYPATASRATATAFETNDKVGVFVYADTATLDIAGNKVNNELLTFDGARWNTAHTLYWDDGQYNVRAYYPYETSVSSIEDYPFSVATDQSSTAEAFSDFLFAAKDSITAGDGTVQLRFSHIMSRLVIRLIKGEDFEGDMPRQADVLIHNTVPAATINLSKGIATKSINAQRATIKAHQDADYIYSAIIVPQRLQTKMPLLEVTINGVSYLCESAFTFKAGTQHVINFIIDKNPEQSLISIGGETSGW